MSVKNEYQFHEEASSTLRELAKEPSYAQHIFETEYRKLRDTAKERDYLKHEIDRLNSDIPKLASITVKIWIVIVFIVLCLCLWNMLVNGGDFELTDTQKWIFLIPFGYTVGYLWQDVVNSRLSAQYEMLRRHLAIGLDNELLSSFDELLDLENKLESKAYNKQHYYTRRLWLTRKLANKSMSPNPNLGRESSIF